MLQFFMLHYPMISRAAQGLLEGVYYGLDVSNEIKTRLKQLRPENYIGVSEDVAVR